MNNRIVPTISISIPTLSKFFIRYCGVRSYKPPYPRIIMPAIIKIGPRLLIQLLGVILGGLPKPQKKPGQALAPSRKRLLLAFPQEKQNIKDQVVLVIGPMKYCEPVF